MDLKLLKVNEYNNTPLLSLDINDTMIISALYGELDGNTPLDVAINRVVSDFNEVRQILGVDEYPLIDEFTVRQTLKKGKENGYCKLIKEHGNNYSLFYL